MSSETEARAVVSNDAGGPDTRLRYRSVAVIVAAILILGALLGLGVLWGHALGTRASTSTSAQPDRRDFLFQINGVQTKNQGGQTMNMYFHYRYNDGIAENDIPNYIDLRTKALDFMGKVDSAANPYWETLDKQLCTELKSSFPIEAISCQLQVYSDDRTGLPYEPGYHGTVYTIGDIEALAIPGSLAPGQ